MALPEAIMDMILEKILNGTDFDHPTNLAISLHTADPGQTGADEVSGGSYARQEPSFGTVSEKSATTDADIEFVDMPDCTITHLGLWGYVVDTWEFIWGGALGKSETVGAGDTVKIPIGDLDVDLT
jgi:hypothetical protein